MSEPAGKYARFELERRFLVERLPDGIEQERGWRITDRYIKNTQLRLRRMEPIHAGEAILKLGQKAVPSPPDFGRMTITNIYLSPEEYAALAILEAFELRKRRYSFAHDGRPFSIDVFENELSGLIVAETSFETAAEMDQELDLPSWAGSEVTQDARFTGGALAALAPEEAVELVNAATGRGRPR
jgi:CYTH domain-containing protein